MIVAIIAILVTLVIVTLGWTMVSRASGNRLASAADQLDSASMAFYADKRAFPTSLDELYDRGFVKFTNAIQAGKRLFYYNKDNEVILKQVSLSPALQVAVGGGVPSQALVYMFQNVPSDQANEFDDTVDHVNGVGGRVILLPAGQDCNDVNMLANIHHIADAPVTICYLSSQSSQ
jgi:hypothetical protein